MSRSNSKSPAGAAHVKSKMAAKLNEIKKGSGDHANDKLNLNNVAKNNIKDKKYNELRDKLAIGSVDKGEK